MKRTITRTPEGQVILTNSNGVSTSTRTVYLRELVDYTPLPNGFNQELADDVLRIIKERPLLWDQGSWRMGLYEGDMDLDQATLARTWLNFTPEEIAETDFCGTAMCFAGWVGELTGANWVLDARARITDPTFGPMPSNVELVLVPDTHDNQVSYGNWHRIPFLDNATADQLHARGFKDTDWLVVPIAEYAERALGLTDGDWRDLFEGNNTIEQLEEIVSEYAEHGPVDSRELEDEGVTF